MIFRIAAKVFVRDGEDNLLLLRRSATHPRYALQWDIPGGFVEDGEDIKAALARELAEEAKLRLDVESLRLLYAKTDFYANGSSGDHTESVVRLYCVGVVQGVRPDVALSSEHDAAEWVPAQKALPMLTATPFESAIRYLTDHRLLDEI